MVRVKVPASSANMGAGFDTLGVALNMYSKLEVEEIESGVEIKTLNANGYVPQDKSNLVFRAMDEVFKATGRNVKGVRIVQDSEIPMTRGLGSSSGCIIGGMLAANVLTGRSLSYPEILDLATKLEGHPDNVAPALYGGMCVSMTDGEKALVKSIKINPKIKFAIMVPDFFVATKKSRGVLPTYVTRQEASFNIQRSSMFVAAMASGDMDMLKYAVQDKMHQSYRKVYIDGFDDIMKTSYECGSRATYLSGSGPTIVSVIDKDYDEFADKMHGFFKENSHQWMCKVLDVDNVGSVVSEVVYK